MEIGHSPGVQVNLTSSLHKSCVLAIGFWAHAHKVSIVRTTSYRCTLPQMRACQCCQHINLGPECRPTSNIQHRADPVSQPCTTAEYFRLPQSDDLYDETTAERQILQRAFWLAGQTAAQFVFVIRQGMQRSDSERCQAGQQTAWPHAPDVTAGTVTA